MKPTVTIRLEPFEATVLRLLLVTLSRSDKITEADRRLIEHIASKIIQPGE